MIYSNNKVLTEQEIKQQREYIYENANALYDKVYRQPEKLLTRLRLENKDTKDLQELLELTRTIVYDKTKAEYDLRISKGVIKLKQDIFNDKYREAKELEAKTQELVKELKEKVSVIKEQKEQIEAVELDAKTHLEALEVAQIWRERREKELWDYIDYLEYKIYLTNKELPPLPKKESKFKQFKKKLVNKVNKIFYQKEKVDDLVAQIEIKK